MLFFIRCELRRTLRNSSTRFMFFILLAFLVIISVNYDNRREVEGYDQMEIRNTISAIKAHEEKKYLLNTMVERGQISQSIYDEVELTLDALIDCFQLAKQAAIEEDWQAFHKNMVIAKSIAARSLEKDGINESILEVYLHNQEDITLYEELFAIPKLTYAYVLSSYEIPQYQEKIFYANYSYQLYALNERGNNRYSVNSGTIFHIFMNEISPLFLVIFIAMLNMDHIFKDRELNVHRALLTNSLTRFQYIGLKIITSLLITIIIIFAVIAISTLFLAITDHFHAMQYPAISSTEGFTSLQTTPSTFKEMNDHGFDVSNGEVFHYGNLKINSVPFGSASPYYKLNFLAMWQFNLLCIPLFALFILFCVSLQTMISVLLRNKYSSLLLTIFVVLLGQLATPVQASGIFAMLNPFMYRNPINVVSGYIPYPYLMGVLVLSVYCIVLIAITTRLYKRKDI